MPKENINTIAFAVLLFISFAVYSNSVNSPFIWDDRYLITENHFIKSFSYLPEIFKRQLYYSTGGISNFYRPLQSLFLTADYAIWKERPLGYHIINILFHALCGIIIYIIIQFLFKRKSIAFMVSALFVVHPVNSIVVNYISSRADSQATFFILLSFLLFAKSVTGPKQDSKLNVTDHSNAHYYGSIASFVCALLSKELGVIAPILILLYIYAIYDKEKKAAYIKTVPFLIILGVYVIMRTTVLNFTPQAAKPMPLGVRLLTTTEAFTDLIGLLWMPLRIHIEKSIPFAISLAEPRVLGSLLFLSFLLAFAFWVKRYSKKCFFGLLWFFVALIPMANIIPINATIADHWLYLPCMGYFLAVIGAGYDIIQKLPQRAQRFGNGLSIGVYVAAVITFSVMTFNLNSVWQEPISFYKNVIKMVPDSFRAHNEIGIIYLDQQKYNEALDEFREAVKFNPGFDQAYDNLGIAYDMIGDYENAIKAHKKALEINPYSIKAYNNMGNAYSKMERLDEAAEAYKNALKLNPNYKAIYNNLGVIYFKKGMLQDAKKYWEQALKIDPYFKMAQDNLAVVNKVISEQKR